jgi:hypothetical protein
VVNKLIDYPDDPCGMAVAQYCGANGITESDVAHSIISCLYRVGAIGVKISTKEPYRWAGYNQSMLSKSQILRINQIKIHKMLRKTLGVREKDFFDKILDETKN